MSRFLRLLALGLGWGLVGCPTTVDRPLADDDDDSVGDDDDSAVADDDDDDDDDDDGTPEDLDWDNDGLPNTFETSIGTDANNEDTDGDGFLDGTEYYAYFRPWDATDFPYTGGYPRSPIPDKIEGEGFNQLQISPDWSAVDQFGQELSLHRFYGNIVIIYIDTEEAPGIGSAAPMVQEAYAELQDQGVVVLNFLTQGLTFGSPPDVDRWVETHGITFPVFSHQNQSISTNYHFDPFVPHWSVLFRNMRIFDISASGYNEWDDVLDQIDVLLDEEWTDWEWPLP
jgi:peroxiredoxin